MKTRLSIQQLTEHLTVQINKKMEQFNELGAKSKDAANLSQQYQKEMYDILKELEPVEYIVRNQHPEMCVLFDALKDEYGKKD